MYRILLLLDKPAHEDNILNALCGNEFQVTVLRRGQRDLNSALNKTFDLAFLSLPRTRLQDDSIIKELLRRNPPTPCVIIATPDKEAQALASVEQGIYDYLLDSDSVSRVLITTSRALQHKQHMSELGRMRLMARQSHSPPDTVGSSPSILKVKNSVEMAASGSGNVIVQGEPGTGKKRTARSIHYMGKTQDGPFVQLNCALVPESLVEVEFFGRETGTFLSDRNVKAGKIEEASGGTLFLVDTDRLHPRLQKRLLKTLLTGEVERVGGTTAGRVDLKVIASSTRDLSAQADAGKFDRELYNLLGSVSISLPPLRARRDDIPFLLYKLIDKAAGEIGNGSPRPDREALSDLLEYDWPGNISELKGLADHLARHRGSSIFTREDLPERMRRPKARGSARLGSDVLSSLPSLKLPPGGVNLKETISGLERALIEKALEASGGKQNEAAAMLGLKRTTLIEKIKRFRPSVQFSRTDIEKSN